MLNRRVLIVDESVVMRRSLADALASDRDLIVGSAASGRIALMKMPLLRPDVVLLDIDMPGTDGLDTLKAIRTDYPATLVIVLTAAAGRLAAVDVVALGVGGHVMKPDVANRSPETLRLLGAKIASRIGSCTSPRAEEPEPPLGAPVRVAVPHRIDLVAIGASTGGPGALMELLPRLAADFPTPIVIVQHMPPTFTRILADRLAAKCRIRVAEGDSQHVLRPGDAWIAPGDFHLVVDREGATVLLRTHQDSRENSCRPSVDVLFRSVAQAYGPHALAVVMTGMGRDGVAGCQEIRAAGGQILVQDEASSIVWGMPSFVVKAGLADQIVPLNRLAQAITDRVSQHRRPQGDLVVR
jgi:two-component system, chemotaxis family, protein-glutamate methylesterase/glutaminase